MYQHLIEIIQADCLFTPKQQKIESFDMRLLFNPFTNLLWLCLLTTTVMITIAKFLILNRKVNSIGIFWESFAANFGGSFDDTLTKKKPYKMLLFLTLFNGNVIWMGYQASLTVDLSISEPKLPFNDLEGLLNSDWKLFTIDKK